MAHFDSANTRMGILSSFAARPSLMQRLNLWASRRALASLDARALDDIGVSREAALEEASKTVWDVPKAWVKC